jgi:hypothetical protein
MSSSLVPVPWFVVMFPSNSTLNPLTVPASPPDWVPEASTNCPCWSKGVSESRCEAIQAALLGLITTTSGTKPGVDFLSATIHVRHSWSREGTLTEPKTKAGSRDIPIAPGLVDMLVTIKPENASDDSFVFSTTGTTPIAYWNFRDRGFVPALTKAGLAGKDITIHGLRSAAISLYAARGLSMLETATIMGQADPGVTWKHYARLFDRSDVEARVRAAQASLGT